MRVTAWAACVLLTSGIASAQSINVNFGDPAGAPSPGYAAAGGAGTWNSISGVAGTTFDLVAIDGAPSGVTMTQQPTTTLLATADAALTGDDAKLLNSGLVTTGAETCLSFSGVQPGRYEVLIYAWVPNAPAVLSRTRQDEAPSTKDVGGAWTGAQVEGVTYARYVVDVGSDGQLPAHSGLVPGAPQAALNGVQFRPLPAAGPDAGAIDPMPPPPPPASHGGGCSTTGSSSGWLLALALAFSVTRRARARVRSARSARDRRRA